MIAGMTPMLFQVLVVGISLSRLVNANNANTFLEFTLPIVSEIMIESDVEADLLSEITSALGPDATDARLTNMEDALRPMYMSLPKNKYGNLGHAPVRYALHRLFVQRHGWYVQGLEPAGGSWNSTSPAEILRGRVPEYILNLFETRMGGHGLNLHEVAVLASALEHFVQSEMAGRLAGAFRINNLKVTGDISEAGAIAALDTYMMAYVTGGNLTSMTGIKMELLRQDIQKRYPYWNETQNYTHQIYQDVTNAELVRSKPDGFLLQGLDFEIVARVASKISEGYGRFQNTECDMIKRDMLKYEDGSSGRVLLSRFYKASLDGMWQLSESVDYLRELGALDESGSDEPSVIVPNYIGAAGNCIATSGFYSVCCLNECEGILGHLEAKVASPHADPSLIAALVADLPSAVVTEPPNLSTSLLQSLDEIASSNGGVVPIHGRLFAQWMHHAFPRKCSYPHLSGTTSPRTVGQWESQTGKDPRTTDNQKLEYFVYKAVVRGTYGSIRESSWRRVLGESHTDAVPEAEDEAALPWTSDEELLAIQPPPQFQTASAFNMRAAICSIVFAVAVIALVRALVQSSSAGAWGLNSEQGDKCWI